MNKETNPSKADSEGKAFKEINSKETAPKETALKERAYGEEAYGEEASKEKAFEQRAFEETASGKTSSKEGNSKEVTSKEVTSKEITPAETLKIILLTMTAVNAVVLLVGLLLTKQPIQFLLGMVIGLITSLISKIMLARAVDKSLDMEVDGAKIYMAGQAYMRMLLVMAVAVGCGFMRNYISIYGLAVSLLVSHMSVYIANFIYEKTGGEKVELNSSEKADRHC